MMAKTRRSACRRLIHRSDRAVALLAFGCLQAFASLPAIGLEATGDAAYPARPLRLVVSFPAGTAVDALGRLVAAKLAASLDQAVVVENRPGAAGSIGTALAARAAPDGYTLAIVGAAVTINPTLHGARAVDPVRAFAPIIQLTTQPIVLVAHPSLEAASVTEMVALARRKPEALAYSTPGVGTPTHIAAELLALQAGISWLHVPYAGSGQLLTDVLAGEVPLSFTLLGAAEPFLRTGRLKAIAVTSGHRVTAFPTIPTVSESGFPNYEITSWHGVVAPAGTPRTIVEQLNRAFDAIVRDREVVARLHGLGMEPAGGTAAAFAARIAAEVTRWNGVIVRAGIPRQP
jgi:tripartite-type tricarboxylate transporter receptor subunit TctC